MSSTTTESACGRTCRRCTGDRAAGAVDDREHTGGRRRDQRPETEFLRERHHVADAEERDAGADPQGQPHEGQHAGLDRLFRRELADGGRILRQALRAVLLSDHFSGSTSAGHQFFGGSRKKHSAHGADHQHVHADQIEDPDVGIRMQGVAEDEDERHCAVGESAVDEPGLAASPLRVPLTDKVDTRRVNQACADAAAYGEAEVGEDQVCAG